MQRNLLVFLATFFAVSAPAIDLPKDTDAGVYLTDGSEWVGAPVETVNWKTGGVVKRVVTRGIIRGEASSVTYPGAAKIEALIHTMEGTDAGEYRLFRLRPHNDAREFRSVTGGAERDVVPFEAVRAAPRLWRVDLSGLSGGEYGFMPPVNAASPAASGIIYTFEIGYCEGCASARPPVESDLKTTVKSLIGNSKNPALAF